MQWSGAGSVIRRKAGAGAGAGAGADASRLFQG
jgi:hypothetical protein